MNLDTFLLDRLGALLAWIGPAGEQALRTGAVAVTPLGSSAVLGAIVAVAAALLSLARRRADGVWLVVTCLAGWAAMHAMKLAFARPRPDSAGHLVEAAGASFPSGHAMMATVVALSLWRLASPRRAGLVPGSLAAAAVTLVVAIGLSRVLTGVHWPTDVLAGWALGAGWATLAWRRRPGRPPLPARR